MKNIYSGLILASLLAGCAIPQMPIDGQAPQQSVATEKNGMPEWVFSPSKDGKLGGVGISSIHMKGRSAQRELAISRALDEIARQMNTKVSTVLKTSATATKTSSSQSMESYSFQTTDGQTVKASIQKFWIDPASDDLYVWMVCDK